MAVLIIRVEIPMVRIANGSANILTNGLIIELTSEKIKPATTYNTHGAKKASVELTRPNQVIQKYIPRLDAAQRKIKTKICFLIIIWL